MSWIKTQSSFSKQRIAGPSRGEKSTVGVSRRCGGVQPSLCYVGTLATTPGLTGEKCSGLSKAEGDVESGPAPLHPPCARCTGRREAEEPAPRAWDPRDLLPGAGSSPCPSTPRLRRSFSQHLADQRRARAATSVSQQDLKALWGQGSRMMDEL